MYGVWVGPLYSGHVAFWKPQLALRTILSDLLSQSWSLRLRGFHKKTIILAVVSTEYTGPLILLYSVVTLILVDKRHMAYAGGLVASWLEIIYEPSLLFTELKI